MSDVLSIRTFLKNTGMTMKELEVLTGYTRHGLYKAFKTMDEEKQPSKQFLTCINSAISEKVESEIQQFTKKIDGLKSIQDKFKQLKEEI